MNLLETEPQSSHKLSADGFLRLFEGAPVAMLIEDSGGKVIDANTAAWELIGGERKDLVGRHAAEVLPPRLRTESAVGGGKRRGTMLTAKGDVAVEMMCVPMMIDTEEVTLVTLWREEDQESGCSVEADARGILSGVVAGIASELSPLMGFTSLLRAGGGRGILDLDHVTEVEDATGRLAALASALRKFLDLPSGTSEPTDVGALVDSFQERLEDVVGPHRLKVELAPDLPEAECDAEWLSVALEELARAEAGVSEGEGEVTLSVDATSERDAVRIVIARSDKDRRGNVPLEHLGLELARAMIGKLGGELAASPEGGWQFTLPAGDTKAFLEEDTDMQEPIDDTSPTNAAAPPVTEQLEFAEVTEGVDREAKAAGPEGGLSSASETATATDSGNSSRDGKETVLVVEDEEMVRDLVKRSLGYLGYDVLDACNGEEGLEVARQRGDEIDMVFSDIVMPRMSGPEMIAKMLEEKIELPVLYTTGFTDNKRLLDNGEIRDGVNLLPKPYTTKVLAARVREVLDAARG